jgi:hypothetical protein
MEVLKVIFLVLRSLLVSRAALAVENLVLLQQLAVLQPRMKRPKLRTRDRLFWVCLSRIWTGWNSALERNAPNKRELESRGSGQVVSAPRVGGLHHRYRCVA